MASLQARLSDLITQLGTDYKSIMTKISGNSTGSLTGLTTTAKTSLVAAVNELDADLAALGTPAQINDSSATNATTTTYSANKINSAISTGIAAVVGAAPAALDTLVELAAALNNSASTVTDILTALTKRVRVDAAQTFTGTEQTQGQDNLSVYSRAQLGDPDTNLVTLYTTAKA